MLSEQDLEKLTTYIEENLRATQNAGMGFIDPKHYKKKMHAKQNHVAFGRRGSGKSSLLSCLKGSNEHFAAFINLEDFKDISFPNVLLHVLKSLYEQIISESLRLHPWYTFDISAFKSRRSLSKKVDNLKKGIESPDNEEIAIREKYAKEEQGNAKVKANSAEAGAQSKTGTEKEESKTVTTDKLERLQLTLTGFKEDLENASKAHGNKHFYLALDDLYFLNKQIQPLFVDFFHRIAKGTNLHIKIATIKHRSILYSQCNSAYIGMESGHDIHDIDMDYSLDKFDELKAFMQSLVEHAASSTGINIAVESLFAGDAFSQLCLASGGVPRDFLSLFLKLADSNLKKGNKIGKIDVTDAAINNIPSKMSNFSLDSGSDSGILEDFLNRIKSYVYRTKRTNSFLVAKEDLEHYKQARQAIRELTDMRLLHLIDNNTSCAPSDGRRYEAYIMDVGLYDNSRPRNFSQLEPGATDSKSRRDKMRASPRLELDKLQDEVGETNLVVTSEVAQQVNPADS